MRIRHALALVALAALLLLAGPSSAAVKNVSITASESISPETAPPGGNVTVTFSATNQGSDPQAPFSLVFNLGPGSWSVGGANDGCTRPDDFDIDCERGSLGPGETFTTSVVLNIAANATPGAIYNSRVFAYPGGTGGAALASDARSIVIAQPAAPPPPPPPPPPGPSTVSVALHGSGGGSVASSPAGIACAGACVTTFAHGTAVTLTATPAAGSVFTGWGDACAGAAQNTSCALTVNDNTVVGATFDLAPTTTSTPPPTTAPTTARAQRVRRAARDRHDARRSEATARARRLHAWNRDPQAHGEADAGRPRRRAASCCRRVSRSARQGRDRSRQARVRRAPLIACVAAVSGLRSSSSGPRG